MRSAQAMYSFTARFCREPAFSSAALGLIASSWRSQRTADRRAHLHRAAAQRAPRLVRGIAGHGAADLVAVGWRAPLGLREIGLDLALVGLAHLGQNSAAEEAMEVGEEVEAGVAVA